MGFVIRKGPRQATGFILGESERGSPGPGLLTSLVLQGSQRGSFSWQSALFRVDVQAERSRFRVLVFTSVRSDNFRWVVRIFNIVFLFWLLLSIE